MNKCVLLFAFLFLGVIAYCQSYEELAKLSSKGKKKEAVAKGLEYLKKDSSNNELNHIVGRALADMGKYNEAIPFLLKGTVPDREQVWIQAWSLAYLGICQYMTGDYEKGRSSMQESIKLNATPRAVSFAKREMKGLMMDDYFDSWHIVETKHIRFHFQDTNDVENVKKYILKREHAYLKNNEFFNAEPFKIIDFFVWTSRQKMKERLGVEWGFAVSKVCMIHACYDQTSGHEITHILSDFGINPIEKSKIINEGIAVYFDQTTRNKMDVAKDDLKGTNISIIDLWNSPEKFPDSYIYSVSGAFVDYLFKNGTEEQIKLLLKNQTVKNAKEVYSNFDELVTNFENDLSKK